ncbi:MAG: hypothetical protein WCC64_07930 [Aliidongia sp.]
MSIRIKTDYLIRHDRHAERSIITYLGENGLVTDIALVEIGKRDADPKRGSACIVRVPRNRAAAANKRYATTDETSPLK